MNSLCISKCTGLQESVLSANGTRIMEYHPFWRNDLDQSFDLYFDTIKFKLISKWNTTEKIIVIISTEIQFNSLENTNMRRRMNLKR